MRRVSPTRAVRVSKCAVAVGFLCVLFLGLCFCINVARVNVCTASPHPPSRVLRCMDAHITSAHPKASKHAPARARALLLYSNLPGKRFCFSILELRLTHLPLCQIHEPAFIVLDNIYKSHVLFKSNSKESTINKLQANVANRTNPCIYV